MCTILIKEADNPLRYLWEARERERETAAEMQQGDKRDVGVGSGGCWWTYMCGGNLAPIIRANLKRAWGAIPVFQSPHPYHHLLRQPLLLISRLPNYSFNQHFVWNCWTSSAFTESAGSVQRVVKITTKHRLVKTMRSVCHGVMHTRRLKLI